MQTTRTCVSKVFSTLELVRRLREKRHVTEEYVLRDAWQGVFLDAVDAALQHATPVAVRRGLLYVWTFVRVLSDYSTWSNGQLSLVVDEAEDLVGRRAEQ